MQTAHQVCVIEVAAGTDVDYNDNFSTSSVLNAIGDTNPQFGIDSESSGDLSRLIDQYGQADGAPKELPNIETACTDSRDPLLTHGQLSALTQIATGTDVTALETIHLYAPDSP